MRTDQASGVRAYIDAASDLLEMPLDAQRRTNVAAVFARIAAYATHLTALELDDAIEIAGEFVP